MVQKKAGRSAVGRAMAILYWFSPERQEATVAQLSSDLGIPPATTYRIVRDLKDWGMIDYDPLTKKNRLGPMVLNFAKVYSQSTTLVKIAHPYMQELRDQTGETVSLNVVIDNERICIDEVRSIHGLHWSVPPGTRGPLYAGSTGKAILAYMEPAQLCRIQETLELKPLTPITPTDWETIHADLDKVRRQGYSVTVGEAGPGVGGCAAPILDEDDHSAGAINLSAPLIRWTDENVERYKVLVRETAMKISRAYTQR